MRAVGHVLRGTLLALWCWAPAVLAGDLALKPPADRSPEAYPVHREVPDDRYVPVLRSHRVDRSLPDGSGSDARTPPFPGGWNKGVLSRVRWRRGPFESVQVNVDGDGMNIFGDAANEPSIAVDPTNPSSMVIGWRQFDTRSSNFRQAGWAFSGDGGQFWAFPGVLESGVFRSDPVLDADAQGNFYYYSLKVTTRFVCDLFVSQDHGRTWTAPVSAFGGDKPWMIVDPTTGLGRSIVYAVWSGAFGCCGSNMFTRSVGGGPFSSPVPIPQSPIWGTIAVAPSGDVYVAGVPGIGTSGALEAADTLSGGGRAIVIARSSNAGNPLVQPSFDFTQTVAIGGALTFGEPNPGGLLGQVWVATDHSQRPGHGNVYLLASVEPLFSSDPLDVMFVRSSDGGLTWAEPVRVNDDPLDSLAWQWFGSMSVAPNGRIDAVWNDTRNSASARLSELYYAYSIDQGETWSQNVAVSPVFDSHIGWPQQNKIGDYFHTRSDNTGVSIAYAATFNGEQDVYFLRIEQIDCNGNGVIDVVDIAQETSEDCNDNGIPDECEADCNANGSPDGCDVAAGSGDCNGNWTPDECEPDFDGDGVIDGCDPDDDNDGVPDAVDICPFSPAGAPVRPDGSTFGDGNRDCRVDLSDYGRFFSVCFFGVDVTPPGAFCTNQFDFDRDTDVDMRDFGAFQRAFSPDPG